MPAVVEPLVVVVVEPGDVWYGSVEELAKSLSHDHRLGEDGMRQGAFTVVHPDFGVMTGAKLSLRTSPYDSDDYATVQVRVAADHPTRGGTVLTGSYRIDGRS